MKVMTKEHPRSGSGSLTKWLMVIAAISLVAVLGLKLVFDNLQDELSARSANERTRLFVGEEIVRGINDIENDLYRLATTTNLHAVRRINRSIDSQLEKLRHDLQVLKQGGTVTRKVRLNIEGRDEMVRSATYVPDPRQDRYVMELIEIAPLLDQIKVRTRELETLLARGWNYQEKGDIRGFFAFHDELDTFLKHIPPYFERLDENANRLFFDSSERLRAVEEELQLQRKLLKNIELILVAVVILLASVISLSFLRRIGEANRRLEAALTEMRVAKEQAERASKAKSEFVSRMSHELRTPLNAIIGFADLLEAEPLSPSHKNYVNLINSSGQHLMELINEVLDHAKIEAGGLTLEQITFDFNATIDSVRTIINDRAVAKGLEFTANIDALLPRFLVGDPTRLRQVLINLLMNAVKFTERGSVELRIAPEGSRIYFSIRDTGIGMDSVALAQLFKPFSQADVSVTRKYGGTGLGLMISKDLVEAMGGNIEVESAPGVGSVFWFWLPLQTAVTPSSDENDRERQVEKHEIAALVSGKVLIVDDNRVNQQLAQAMLNRLGLANEAANNGAEALRRLASAEYSLVLMDMEMPEMDGITATQRIRARETEQGLPRLPVIAMTANALQEDRDRCFAAGMDGYIAKPINMAALRAEVSRLFSSGDAKTVQLSMTPLTTDHSAPIHDRAAAIALTGDEELYLELAGMFMADAPTYLDELDDAQATGDMERLARAAHTLKGLFATFVAPQGEAVARQLEKQAHEADQAACQELVKAVRIQTSLLVAALAKQ